MIALAALLAVQVGSPVPPAVQAYYDCAAGGVDRLATRPDRPHADIVAEAIAECAPLRGAAFEQGADYIVAEPETQAWLRARNIGAEEARLLGEVEFDRALRRQLTINLARIRREGRSDSAGSDWGTTPCR